MAISYKSIKLQRLLPPGDPAGAWEIVTGMGLHEIGLGAREPATRQTGRGPGSPAPSRALGSTGQTARETAENAPEDGPSARPKARPYTVLNMVATADGRATLDGRSGPISGEADRAMFHALRAVVDAVMAGAGTVRTERYGPIVRDPERRRARVELGLAERPLACIVSASLDLPPDLPLLADPDSRVAILTSSSGRLPGGATGAVANAGTTSDAGATGAVANAGTTSDAGATGAVANAGATANAGAVAAELEYVRARREDGSLDLKQAMAELQDRLQVRTLLCEGGPHLNSELLAQGLVDELFLSVSPLLAGGDPSPIPAGGRVPPTRVPPTRVPPTRILAGAELEPAAQLELKAVLKYDSQLFLRYGVRAEPRG